MKLTLRKANAIQITLVDTIEKLDFKHTVSLTEFEYPQLVITDAVEHWQTMSEQRALLLDALYEIRKMVAKANAGNAGVSDILADIARTDKDIRFYSIVERADPRVPHEVLIGKLGKIKEQTGESRGTYSSRADTVSTTIFGKTDIDVLKTLLQVARKEKVRLQDALLEANIRNEIELSDETSAVLWEEGIV
jgi:hypothetical protein